MKVLLPGKNGDHVIPSSALRAFVLRRKKKKRNATPRRKNRPPMTPPIIAPVRWLFPPVDCDADVVPDVAEEEGLVGSRTIK